MSHAPSLPSILVHTPLWVWAVLALLVALGLQRTRDRIVTIWRTLMLPAVMTVLALSGLVGGGVSTLPATLAGLAAGFFAGTRLEGEGSARRLPDGRLWLRGEWWSLAQILVIFALRYAINVIAVVDPALASAGLYRQMTALLSGFLAALFIGRSAARLRVYLAAAPGKDRADPDRRDLSVR